MNAITPMQFGEFFEALYGYGPFPWQAELARRVADAQPGDACWPQALALPTAAGKTACIDMAIFALACQADRAPGERTAPRRIFFVVDRRVIVDETFERARNLAKKLRDAQKGADGILKDVADRLCSLAQDDDPLVCFQLRGGMYRDDAWARSPLQPTVVVTTVDQFGSRLLFRGYGSSPSMRPIHAGLAANDCLVLLDEAHCAKPFRQTVSSVQRYREWAAQSGSIGATPFHLTLISATPPQEIAEVDRFTAGAEDREHPVLGRRINASKPAKLLEVKNRRTSSVSSVENEAPEPQDRSAAEGSKAESDRRRRALERQALERLAQQIGDEAKNLVSDERKAIGVIVNRVCTARLVHKRLTDEGHDSVLLTGRMRSIDRDDVAGSLESLKTGVPRNEQTRFIVATQTLEVGADLDFDGLATECASLDALRQRFGRLNRAGRDIEALAVIVVRGDQTNPKTADDPVYGAALAETWQWLNQKAGKDVIDFGYAAMEGIIPEGEDLDKLLQQAPDAPVMLPAHVDAWAQTWPAPASDPDPAIFLHGPARGAPEVQVCWRADLLESDLSGDGEKAVDVVSLCPPASSECISVPIHVLRRWLAGTDNIPSEDNDLEGAFLPEEDLSRERRGRQRSVLCWRGPTESRPIVGHADAGLRPGDTVVIPEESKGWGVFGHIPVNPDRKKGIIDLGDRAHLQSRAKAVLRIHTKAMESWPEPARIPFAKITGQTDESEDTDEDENELQQALEALAQLETKPEWAWLKDAAASLAGDSRRKQLAYPGGRGFALQGSRRVQKYRRSASTLTSEDDSYSATVLVTLEDHLEGVERWAKHTGEGVGLPDSLAADLALAARLHDVGKADPRFQTLLYGGNPWAVGPTLLAKSGKLPTSGREGRRAKQESGYPQGNSRHPHALLSVRLIENNPDLLELAHDRDLVLHLVASHHGECRPFAPAVGDSEPVKVEETILGYQMSASSDTGLERLDSGVPERFWLLVRRYGWWGLAYLEALMRVADHRCSEAEQKKSDDSDSQAKEATR